jgi:MFS family permease
VTADSLWDPHVRTLLVAFGALFFVTELYTAALPLLFDTVGLSAAAFGLARSVAAGVETAGSAWLGALADDHGRVRVALVACLAVAVALVGFAVAGSLPTLVGLVVVVAVGRLGVTNAITPAVSAAFDDGEDAADDDDDNAGVGWGLRDVVLYGGSALGLAVGGRLTALSDVRAVFPALAVVVLGLAALLWRRVDEDGDDEESGDRDDEESGDGDDSRSTTEEQRGDVEPTAGTETVEAAESTSEWSRTRRTVSWVRSRLGAAVAPFRDLPRPWVFARIAVVTFTAEAGGAALAFLPLLAVDTGGSAAGFLAVYGAAHLLAAPLSVVGGVLADRLSRKRLYVINFLTEAAMLAAFAGTALAGVETVAFVAGLALFVLQTAFEPAVLAYFFGVFPESERGRVWGVDGTVARAAGLLSPVLLGWLYGIDPQLPFLLGAGLVATGTVVATTLPNE